MPAIFMFRKLTEKKGKKYFKGQRFFKSICINHYSRTNHENFLQNRFLATRNSWRNPSFDDACFLRKTFGECIVVCRNRIEPGLFRIAELCGTESRAVRSIFSWCVFANILAAIYFVLIVVALPEPQSCIGVVLILGVLIGSITFRIQSNHEK